MSFNPRTDPVKIIQQGDVDRLVELAEDVGVDLKRKELSTNQIRNIFGEVRTLEMNWQAEPDKSFRSIVLLQPKLAYVAARETGWKAKGVKELERVLSPCLEQIQKAPKDQRHLYFSRFVDFFEAILAYHKAAGGK